MADRAVVFIDGNNWYHGLRDHLGLRDLLELDYSAISRKLLGPRTWAGTRYYIGRVQQQGNTELYASQRRFLARLVATHPLISYHLGRLESRTIRNEAAAELREYLSNLKVRIDPTVFGELMTLAKRHREAAVIVEKAVDVHLAVDMVVMAERDEYDAAYLLSADGDFTPAVHAVKSLERKVYAASPLHGAQLGAAVNAFIHLDAPWFNDCYLP
jgi:uncharacterized LabA/DUF88 family protein